MSPFYKKNLGKRNDEIFRFNKVNKKLANLNRVKSDAILHVCEAEKSEETEAEARSKILS